MIQWLYSTSNVSFSSHTKKKRKNATILYCYKSGGFPFSLTIYFISYTPTFLCSKSHCFILVDLLLFFEENSCMSAGKSNFVSSLDASNSNLYECGSRTRYGYHDPIRIGIGPCIHDTSYPNSYECRSFVRVKKTQEERNFPLYR
jgi:hypothetical protein